MTPTTQTVRDQGFLTVECDVPEGVTLREWSGRRGRSGDGRPGRRRWALRGRRR